MKNSVTENTKILLRELHVKIFVIRDTYVKFDTLVKRSLLGIYIYMICENFCFICDFSKAGVCEDHQG